MDEAYIALGLAILLLLSIMAINNRDIVYAGLKKEAIMVDVSEDLKEFKDVSSDLGVLKDQNNKDIKSLDFEEGEFFLKTLELGEKEVETALLNEEICKEDAKEEMEYLEYLRENHEGLGKKEFNYDLNQRLEKRSDNKKDLNLINSIKEIRNKK